jgi:hypothetical protein
MFFDILKSFFAICLVLPFFLRQKKQTKKAKNGNERIRGKAQSQSDCAFFVFLRHNSKNMP